MAREFTVIWAAKIMADDEEDAASSARRAIALAPHSYFDVYPANSEYPYSVEVPNDEIYLDNTVTQYLPLAPKTNN